MDRVWGLFLLCLSAWEFTQNSATLNRSILSITTMRHKLLVNPDDFRNTLCRGENPWKGRIFWRENGGWIDVCTSARKTGGLSRIWRIQCTDNYRMLFLPEVPITFAIVIKR